MNPAPLPKVSQSAGNILTGIPFFFAQSLPNRSTPLAPPQTTSVISNPALLIASMITEDSVIDLLPAIITLIQSPPECDYTITIFIIKPDNKFFKIFMIIKIIISL
jgi:hypothetical protein